MLFGYRFFGNRHPKENSLGSTNTMAKLTCPPLAVPT